MFLDVLHLSEIGEIHTLLTVTPLSVINLKTYFVRLLGLSEFEFYINNIQRYLF